MIQRFLQFMESVLLDEKVIYAVLPCGENFDGVTYCNSLTLSENIRRLNSVFPYYTDIRISN